MLRLQRIEERFYEYVDGESVYVPGDEFNVEGTPHRADVEWYEYEFDEISELADIMRRDGVSFDEEQSLERALMVDGSVIIDYAIGERERVTWLIEQGTWSERIALVALVDRVPMDWELYENGQPRRLIEDLKPSHFLRQALVKP